MPKNNRARVRAARALMGEYQELTYTEALAMLSQDRPGVDHVLLAPYPDEDNVDASQLGWRILLPDATPAQKATAEVIWEPVTDARPCRCSGPCRHGLRCGEVFSVSAAGQLLETECEGRLIHTGRIPHGLLDVTEWLDTYACRTCACTDESLVTLPGLPWGRLDTSGGPGITVIAYPTGHLGSGEECARIEIPPPGDADPRMARGFTGAVLERREAERELQRAVARDAGGRQAPVSADAALAAIRPLWGFVTPDAVRYVLGRAAEAIVERGSVQLARDIAAATPSPPAAAILAACAGYVAASRDEQPGPPGVPHDVLARRVADDPAMEQEALLATAVLLAAACYAGPETP